MPTTTRPHCATCSCTPEGRVKCPVCGRVVKVRVDGRLSMHRPAQFGSVARHTCDGSFTTPDTEV